MNALSSWLPIPPDSDFSIHNLPFGIFSYENEAPRLGMAIGNHALDLARLAGLGVPDDLVADRSVFAASRLNAFISLGKAVTGELRLRVQRWLCQSGSPIQQNPDLLYPQSHIRMHLPVEIGDYTDFYSSIEHATNVGRLFRDPENALLPNWRHLPVGYHGRASSIVVSGTPVRRPRGQVKPKDAELPVFQASARLDFELEMAFIVGKNTVLGESVDTAAAEDYIFGLALFNDWSARDIQQWEYVPLGPFLGKNFASSISPWIVTLEALEPFRVAGPVQEPPVLPYLARAHHTVNGCNLRVGDVMASGTISGPDEQSYGSMLELARAGTRPLRLGDGSSRVFIQDYDTVILRGHGEKDGVRVGFGEVSGKVLPAL